MSKAAELGVARTKRLEFIARTLGREKKATTDVLMALLENMQADIELMQHLIKLQKGAK